MIGNRGKDQTSLRARDSPGFRRVVGKMPTARARIEPAQRASAPMRPTPRSQHHRARTLAISCREEGGGGRSAEEGGRVRTKGGGGRSPEEGERARTSAEEPRGRENERGCCW